MILLQYLNVLISELSIIPLYLFTKTWRKVKDRRYNALKTYIDSGEVNGFSEIFEIVPKSIFVRDSGINFSRLTNKINNPAKFTVKDILVISQLINIDSNKLYGLIAKAADKKQSGKK